MSGPPSGVVRGVLVGLAIACGVVACARTLEPPEWQRRQAKMTEITTLWAQIRDWRRAAHMACTWRYNNWATLRCPRRSCP